MQFFVFFGFIFVVLQYLQLVRGDSAIMSAVSMLPMAACIDAVGAVVAEARRALRPACGLRRRSAADRRRSWRARRSSTPAARTG